MKIIFNIALLFLVIFHSCKNTFDLAPGEVVAEENMYQDLNDADAAVLGIYGQFASLAKQYVILNELRADLLTVTENTVPELQQINNHTVLPGNSYTDPRTFYKVIFSCNDALYHFRKMQKENRLSQNEFAQRYSDIGALRSWIYLQLGIHYGTVPYITENVQDPIDLTTINKKDKIGFDVLLDSLVTFTSNLPTLEAYSTGSSLLLNIDGIYTDKIFVNKHLLLGELYLWTSRYTEAAVHYRKVMETGGDTNTDLYKIIFSDVVTNNDLSVGYIRYREQDFNSLINNNSQGWRSIFSRSRDDLWNSEWLWSIPFNNSFEPEFPFVSLFESSGGAYQLKPSNKAISAWNSQIQHNGFPFDARGMFSYTIEAKGPVVKKYTYSYNPLLPLNKSGNWHLARAASLHLRFAEAANRVGYGRLAYALLNNGIGTEYDDTSLSDKTNVQQTFLPAPFDFDARNSGTTGAPYYRATWYKNTGIRNRAYLKSLNSNLKNDMEALEDALINEAGLELAFEGNRWADLVRIAKRRNQPEFLARRIYDKLEKDENPLANEIYQKLLNIENWYLPFQ
ncbi:RagB/SusD family nutrient uptake outer membrane protein [Sphingobacterium sp. LRF_L2]|uniref:RagB/SusD family nutrient uptake outer membrane protein n=1 Tax=Sphingobacterium sp. LRF_L2 TaxID=3369421 RepID=UPI003F62E630